MKDKRTLKNAAHIAVSSPHNAKSAPVDRVLPPWPQFLFQHHVRGSTVARGEMVRGKEVSFHR